ncbi:hypothetical protein NA57DRAFT_76056 [Rhizodiscina lignyota]|uniref:Integral membrane protein n=1 Tax=Rhizodiscina lignyota TaxID=1504668 RepID=A0A9P4M637_9PEZI|nr:hypothetical protein NA57DRAFT_76056 [Rhizodiscina lignyota]
MALLQRCVASHSLRLLLAVCFLFLLAIWYGKAHFYRDPLSAFYDPSRAFERGYSFQREKEAQDWKIEAVRRLHQSDAESFPKKGDDARICAVFITFKREENSEYIDLAVSSALANLKLAERENIDIRIYFANTKPEVHPAWHSWLDDVVDESFTASEHVSGPLWERLERLEMDKDYVGKGRLDYTVALDRCWSNSSAPYIAIIEGDVLLAEGWLARTISGLLHIAKTEHVDWLDLRLFGADVSIGWASKELLGNNVFWISLGVGLPVLMFLILLRRRSQTLNPHLSTPSLFIICFIAIPGFIILFFQAGKGSTLPVISGVHRQDTFGCCTQAQVFNRQQIPDLVEHMRNEEFNLPHDLAINQFRRDRGLARFALYPIIAQHFGFHSIINPNRSEEMPIWSIGFEDLKPSRLAQDHEKMVKEIYGSDAWS